MGVRSLSYTPLPIGYCLPVEKSGHLRLYPHGCCPLMTDDLLLSCFSFIANYEGEIPGATERDCGNFRDMNLPVAKWWAKKYLEEVLHQLRVENTQYPA